MRRGVGVGGVGGVGDGGAPRAAAAPYENHDGGCHRGGGVGSGLEAGAQLRASCTKSVSSSSSIHESDGWWPTSHIDAIASRSSRRALGTPPGALSFLNMTV